MAKGRICENCKNPFTGDWEQDNHGNHICPYCGTVNDFTYADTPEDDPRSQLKKEVDEIYPLLENLAFDAADRKLSELRKKYPTASKVWFLSALAQYYVCYTKESGKSDKYIPTLNNLNLESLQKSQFVAKALELAPSELVKSQYQQTFDYIETKRSEIQRDYEKKENKYDVFISVKIGALRNGKPVLDENGQQIKSADFGIAFDLYQDLRDKGYRVFFSESADFKAKVAGNKYENIIYAALHSAKAFILVGESIENLESRWVKNEWLRYLYLKDHEKPNEVGTHNMVLATKSLTEGDLPRELQGNQFINLSSVSASRQLDAFIARALASGQDKVAHLEAKSYDTEVAKIDLSSLKDDGFVSRKLSNKQVAATQSEQADLERIAEALDPKYPRDRDEAFAELESMVEANPNFYAGKKLLLLKGTSYFRFEDYINKPEEIADNPKIAKDFMEFATEDEAKEFLNNLLKTMAEPTFYFGYDREKIAKEGDARNKWLNNSVTILNSLITPYLSSLKKESIKAYYKKLDSDIELVGGKNKAEQELVQIYFGLDRYLNGKDGLAYCKIRETYLMKVAKKAVSDKAVLSFTETILKEIQEVNPGAVIGPWFMLFTRNQMDVLEPKEALKKIEDGASLFSIVGNKENLKAFDQFIRYAPSETRPIYLQVFLSSIINDAKTYASEEDGSLVLSANPEGDDSELNGVDLFNRYIGYPLPSTVYPSNASKPFESPVIGTDSKVVQREPLFAPNVNVYTKKKKPLPIDRLIATLAVKLHQGKHFEEAHSFYQLYLGQQPGPNSLDYALVRYYDELAKIHVTDSDSLLHTGRPLDHKTLENELIQLRKTEPEAQKLYEAVREDSNFQRDYSETYQSIKEITAKIPESWHIDDIDNLKAIQAEIEDAISKVGKGVANDIRKEFAPVLKRFENDLPTVEEAKAEIEAWFPGGEIDKETVRSRLVGYANGTITKAKPKAKGKKKGKNIEKAFKSETPVTIDSEKYLAGLSSTRDEIRSLINDYDTPSLSEAHIKAIVSCTDQLTEERKARDARDKRFQGYKAFLYGIATFLVAILNTLIMGIVVIAAAAPAIYMYNQTLTGFIVAASGYVLTIIFFFVSKYLRFLPSEPWTAWHSYIFRGIAMIASIAASVFVIYSSIQRAINPTEISWQYWVILGGAIIAPLLYMVVWYVDDKVNFITVIGGIAFLAFRLLLLAPTVIVLFELFRGWGGVNCFEVGFFNGTKNLSVVGLILGAGGLFVSAVWNGIENPIHIHEMNIFYDERPVIGRIHAIVFAIVAVAAAVFGVLSFFGSIGSCAFNVMGGGETPDVNAIYPIMSLIIGGGSAVAAYFTFCSAFDLDIDPTLWF